MSINELGQIAFQDSGIVLSNPDGTFRRIIDSNSGQYEGVRISSVFPCSEALNDLGQIVMTVQSENPETFELRSFIVKATPRSLRIDD
jgi:hypothetical protein